MHYIVILYYWTNFYYLKKDDSFENGKGYVYLVFEYMHHDLTGLLDTHWDDLSLEQIKSFIQQLFRGILFCHQRKVLHRDIKGITIDRILL